ncbi:hypothetical protein GA0074694_4812 [Micromonospora inyonensis]|uniref:Uncharacterized protein n=1 Tax=Micromonospora inyonensis TaxID=47866 RepID=A0A1C6SDL4_9ACTN|nr:hypothetical protein GA0074694_4812 [Micromonospora inyonensis]
MQFVTTAFLRPGMATGSRTGATAANNEAAALVGQNYDGPMDVMAMTGPVASASR